MKKFIKKLNLFTITILVISVLLLWYVAYRSHNISITYDEAYTYTRLITNSFQNIITFKVGSPANNHLLNTILVKIFTGIVGVSVFKLRFISLIAFAFYLFFSYLISKSFKSKFTGITAFVLLTINPFVLEFFSLCRGYSLALTFMMGSLVFLLRSISNTKSQRNWVYTFIFASLAVFSNLSFFNYYLWLFFLFQIRKLYLISNSSISLKSKLKEILLKDKLVNIISIFTVTCALAISLMLKHRNKLYFGGNKNFWNDTVVSLINGSVFRGNYPELMFVLIKAIVLILIISATVIFLSKLISFKKENLLTNKFSIIYMLLSLISLGTIAQFYILHTKYLVQRTALLFVPLFILTIVFLFEEFKTKISKLIIKCCCGILIIFSLFNFYKSIDFEYSALYAIINRTDGGYSYGFSGESEGVVKLLNELNGNKSKDLVVTDNLYAQTYYYIKRDKIQIGEIFVVNARTEINYKKGELVYVETLMMSKKTQEKFEYVKCYPKSQTCVGYVK